ncbi:HAD family hydrolase [Actinopolyspora saharensis]|uniref:HAD family hydrolase n=1 Tax=Actinopolyspora saharensis TaxID=995062 RepID=UPI001FDF1DD8|nr:HAD family hydrolase [Actinopolyspora saharensis]
MASRSPRVRGAGIPPVRRLCVFVRRYWETAVFVGSDRAVALGWDGALVLRERGGARLTSGADELLRGARAASIPVVVLTGTAVDRVASEARRLRVAEGLAIVIAGVEDEAAELRALATEYPCLARVAGSEEEIRAARRAGVLAFGFSGGGVAGARLRAAGAEAVLPRLDRALALRVTARRLFTVSGGALIERFSRAGRARFARRGRASGG